jgi:hypothetical protein
MELVISSGGMEMPKKLWLAEVLYLSLLMLSPISGPKAKRAKLLSDIKRVVQNSSVFFMCFVIKIIMERYVL